MKYWTKSWNPMVGCHAVSPGCQRCWAAQMADTRLKHLDEYAGLTCRGMWTGEVKLRPERLLLPASWKKPESIHVELMGDLFHPCVPFDYIAAVFGVMQAHHGHAYLALTKRAKRAAEFFRWLFESEPSLRMAGAILKYAEGQPRAKAIADRCAGSPVFGSYIWVGVSVETRRDLDERAPWTACFAGVQTVLHFEPLLEDMRLDVVTADMDRHLNRSRWWIVGGETGPRARECRPEWVDGVVRNGANRQVATLVKHLGKNIVDPNSIGDQLMETPEASRIPAAWVRNAKLVELLKERGAKTVALNGSDPALPEVRA